MIDYLARHFRWLRMALIISTALLVVYVAATTDEAQNAYFYLGIMVGGAIGVIAITDK